MNKVRETGEGGANQGSPWEGELGASPSLREERGERRPASGAQGTGRRKGFFAWRRHRWALRSGSTLAGVGGAEWVIRESVLSLLEIQQGEVGIVSLLRARGPAQEMHSGLLT